MANQDEIVKERMIRALRLAKEAWEEAKMPVICYAADENAKIGISILAREIFRSLNYKP